MHVPGVPAELFALVECPMLTRQREAHILEIDTDMLRYRVGLVGRAARFIQRRPKHVHVPTECSLKSGPAVCRLDADEPVRNSKWQIVGLSEVWLSKNISRTFHTRRGALC